MSGKLITVQGLSNKSPLKAFQYRLKVICETQCDVHIMLVTDKLFESMVQTVPFEYEFTAMYYYIFYQSVGKPHNVRVEMYTDKHENIGVSMDTLSSASEGTSGKGHFIDDPRSNLDICGGL